MIRLLSQSAKHSDLMSDTSELFMGVQWKRDVLKLWNDPANFLQIDWQESDVSRLFTNAAGLTAFAAFFNDKWFYGRWMASVRRSNMCNTWLELYPNYVECYLWCVLFTKRRIIFQSDNMGVVYSWQNLASSNQHILRENYRR